MQYMDVTPVAIAKRLRQEFLRRDIPSDSEAARQAGVAQQWLSRRLTGQTAWALPELVQVCDKLDLSLDYVLCGQRENAGIPVESLVKLLAEHVSETGESTGSTEPKRGKADIGGRITRPADARQRLQD